MISFSKEEPKGIGFSRTQSYFDKSPSIRFAIGFFFGICLFLFLHFRETYVESLELGNHAKRYIVAQVDFSFPDEEATIILKQQAAHEIGPVYQIQSSQIQDQVNNFQRFITQDEEGMRKFEEANLQNNFEELAVALGLFVDGLTQSRYTDMKTIQRLDEFPADKLPINKSFFFPFLPSQENFESRLPSTFWNTFEKKIFKNQKISLPVLRLINSYFEPLVWQLAEDQGTEYTLRKLAQASIPEKYSRVKPGERLIDQGEKVTSRHIAMLQSMKEKLSQKRNLLDPITIGGSLLMTLLFLVISSIYLQENHNDIFYSNRRLSLLVTILLLALIFAKASELFLIRNTTHLIDLVRFPLFVPFAAILLSSLIQVRIAAFVTIFLALIFSMALAVDPIPFLVINILTSMVAVLGTRGLRRRKEVFVVCLKAWMTSAFVILAFNLYENTAFSFPLIGDLTSTFLFMTLTAILVVGLLPILESTFHIMTDITLMEFMDPGNELLRRLTVEAPGTHQHSMVVGNLAEAAASAIGASGLFCRVATQYHDIGKLANSQYFSENQLGGVDMHQLLTPKESAQVIIAHVSEGVALARKVGLPEQFIDVIKEHHGTTLVYYFYRKQLEALGGEKSQVDEREFRYSGPKPRTKESTIIMIADCIEAASRSLEVFNEETVNNLVESLIVKKTEDGQFDESLLTFEELGTIKQSLVKTLMAASHPRVKYPVHHPEEEV